MTDFNFNGIYTFEIIIYSLLCNKITYPSINWKTLPVILPEL